MLLGLLLPWSAGAQEGGPRYHPGEVFVGSEAERYLRVLQVAGEAELYPWTVRGFTAGEAEDLFPPEPGHPWAARFRSSSAEPSSSLRVVPISPWTEGAYNSAFPSGANDGPVWAGRGFTGAAGGGFAARWGPVELTVAPTVFWAENRTFELAPTGLSDAGAFRDPREPGNIDLPQRFGDSSLSRIDPGESSLHLYLPGAVLGLSSRAQWYGPAVRHSVMLGNNAGGFPHAFVGTRRPLDLWLVKLHGRFMAGRLEQSDFSPITTGESRRLSTAATAVVTPRGVDGLELGVTSFAHAPWPQDGVGIDDLLQPLSLEFGGGRRNPDVEGEIDHLVSAFLRWTVPGAGLEVYGELVREDWAPNARFLAMIPEDLGGYLIGLQKVWQHGTGALTAFRGELVNTRWHHSQRGHRARGDRSPRPRPLYVHSRVRQGHTHRGQLLVSPAAYGGSGVLLGLDRYDAGGRWSVELERVFLGDWHLVSGQGPDNVVYSLAVEAVRFLDDFELSARIRPSWELNRHLVEDRDRFNLNLSLGVRYR